ncbi:hypothetical protein CAPTEDRAFT_107782 [Capitella teleta]|uniref:Dynein heavy chain tail domain-containing protein n=1 Tax=Capitella teleta TaxID=283909 RepID=R7U5Z1_CAPTE|nr:hypothetical protein CAPTEDRAFT_107782 [Capitella teleta]|eukprot:ELU01785.1 hypothetical protein CAPTEDRAFT_107782 [Capitella teleta]
MTSKELDDKLKWLETRINSSLRPRNDDLKQLFHNDENRLAFHEFFNNEDVRRLFIFTRTNRSLVASLQPPHELKSKSIFFLKNNEGIKLTKDNLSDDNALRQLDLLTREVYLPLLCTEVNHANRYGINADKLMDILHRLMATVETAEGNIAGEITLPLPSIEVLAEAANTVNRRAAVLHVLETTIIGWMKQIKSVLKHDPVADLERQAGDFPGPLDEIALWESRLEKLYSINRQLDSSVAVDILRNLEEANSNYGHSFSNIRKEISKAIQDTKDNLVMLSSISSLCHDLHDCLDPQQLLKLFPPLINTLLLVWRHSKYYHQPDKFHNLLRLLSNEVVHRAEAMVGEDVLHEPLDSYSKLKEALRVCAAFRGTYLDYREKAEELNEKNCANHAENAFHKAVWPQCLLTKVRDSHDPDPSLIIVMSRYGIIRDETTAGGEVRRDEELRKESEWPPRNAPAFDLLNAFMERCNDVLELVQTTRHFRLLADTAEIGGAGTASLDSLVKDIHHKYSHAMDAFFSQVSNVLAIDGSQTFEKAFFTFRCIVKDLEKKLAGILRQSFLQCSTIAAQLRLLEVFEGVSSRELVQIHLKDKDSALVRLFTQELVQIHEMFKEERANPPQHKNMPPVVSKLTWIYALQQRAEIPMKKMKKVSPQSLEGESGWQLREAYADAMKDMEKFESDTVQEWQKNITAELAERLKQPLLLAEEYDEEEELRPQVVHVNLDPKLLLLLREIHYLAQEPFSIRLPGPARELLRNTNSQELRVTATRLDTIVSKYNMVMKTISSYEMPLFERSLAKIDLLFEQGLHEYTWRTVESADFIETAAALVCVDLHLNLDIVQTNCQEITQLTLAWSKNILDVFAAQRSEEVLSLDTLCGKQLALNEDFEQMVIPAGHRIHHLLDRSYQAVNMSEASPAWQDYIDYMDAVILDGLKQTCLTSLKSMLNQIVHCNRARGEVVPILMIRLELIENEIAFRPPLDQSTSYTSVQETIHHWLDSFLARGRLIEMLSGKGSYVDYISVDEEVQQLITHIDRLVRDNALECRNLFELFKEHAFLWQQDVTQTFQDFLRGKGSPSHNQSSARKQSPNGPSNMRLIASARSSSRFTPSPLHKLC